MVNLKLLLFIPLFLLIVEIPVFAQSEDLKKIPISNTNNTNVTNFESSPILIDIVEKIFPGSLVDWISIISGIATVILAIIVWNELIITKKDISSRLRPWIAPVDVQAVYLKLPNGRIVNFEEIPTTLNSSDKETAKVIMQITIKNMGSIPASKINYRLLKREKEIVSEDVEKEKILQEGSVKITAHESNSSPCQVSAHFY